MTFTAPLTFLWIIWVLLFVATLLMTAILSYHWKPHKMYDKRVKRAGMIFYIGAALLLLGSAIILLSL